MPLETAAYGWSQTWMARLNDARLTLDLGGSSLSPASPALPLRFPPPFPPAPAPFGPKPEPEPFELLAADLRFLSPNGMASSSSASCARLRLALAAAAVEDELEVAVVFERFEADGPGGLRGRLEGRGGDLWWMDGV